MEDGGSNHAPWRSTDVADDISEAAELVVRQAGGSKADVVDSLQRLREYGVDVREAAKTVLYRRTNPDTDTVFGVRGVGLPEGHELFVAGVQSPEELATTSPERVANLSGLGESHARVLVESAELFVGDRDEFVRELASEAGQTVEQIETDLEQFLDAGVPPSEAAAPLRRVYGSEPTLMDVCDVDARVAHYLSDAGYGSLQEVLGADEDELTDVQYVGPATAESARRAAKEYWSDLGSGHGEGTTDRTGSGDNKSEDRSVDEPHHGSERGTNNGGETGGDEQMRSTTEHEESQVSRDEPKLRLLVVGSLRPNVEHDDNAGIRIRAVVQNSELEFSEFDAALFTGLCPPSSFHERHGPDGFAEELEEQLSPLTRELPVYFVTGDFGHGDPLELVYDDEYAPGARLEPFAFGSPPEFHYVPIQGTNSLGEFELTQNPDVARTTENCLLVTPDLYSELWGSHDSVAYVAGGQLAGRWKGDSLAPSFTIENIGPQRKDTAGTLHAVTVGTDGIERHDTIHLGDVEMESCDKHIDRGVQFVRDGTGCVFCHDPNQYFKELWQSGVHKADPESELETIVESVSREAMLSGDQVDDFESFVNAKLSAGGLTASPNRENSVETDVGSPLMSDPRNVYHRMTVDARSELNVRPRDRATYHHRHDVSDVETLHQESTFEDVRPPAEEDAQVELDELAFNEGMLQGEWIIFPKTRIVGTVWENILQGVADGELYDAQIATAWHRHARGERSDRHALSVAVPNYFDTDDVLRVGNLIDEETFSGYDGTIIFKPFVYSMLRITKRNKQRFGLSEAVRFRLSQLRDGL